jgi:hypothetical protein
MRAVVVVAIFVGGCSFTHGTLLGAGTDGSGGGMPGIDAPTGFDPASCPQSYTVTLASSASRYRFDTQTNTFWHFDHACSQDSVGLTHLAVLDDLAEATELGAVLAPHVNPPTNGWFFVGAVQAMNQATPSTGWSWLTGGAVATTWAPGEPDDGTGTEANQENLAVVDGLGQLHDVFEAADSGHVDAGGVCECDGKAMSSTIRSQIPQDPT